MPDEIERDVASLLNQEPVKLRKAVVSKIKEAVTKTPEQTHIGALKPAEEEFGHRVAPSRRQFLNQASLGYISLGVASASLALSADALFDRHRDKDEHSLQIRREFAQHMSTVNYGAEEPLTGYRGAAPLTLGEWAVRDSMVALRRMQTANPTSGEPSFSELHDTLWKAVHASDDHHGKAMALSRLAIDSSFLGDGITAESALAMVEFDKLEDRNVILRMLDFGTSIALNAISPENFFDLSSDALDNINSGWLAISLEDSAPRKIASLAQDFGVGVFVIAQRAGIQEVKRASSLGRSTSDARRTWFNLVRDTMHWLPSDEDKLVFGEDYLYSLHRPTFHAAAAGDHHQVREMISYYMNSSGKARGIEASIDGVRENFRRNMPGSSPWMFLLDAAYEQEPVVAEAKLRHIASLSNSRSPQFKKALASLWSKVGLNRTEMLQYAGISETSLQFPPTSLHRVYMNQAGAPARY